MTAGRRSARLSRFAHCASAAHSRAQRHRCGACLCRPRLPRARGASEVRPTRARVRRARRRLRLPKQQRSFGRRRIGAAAPIRPTQQRAGAPSSARGLLLLPEAGVSPGARGRRPTRQRRGQRPSCSQPRECSRALAPGARSRLRRGTRHENPSPRERGGDACESRRGASVREWAFSVMQAAS
jgi:hypothetical protein